MADGRVVGGAGRCQLLLEPNDNAAARAYQKAIYEQGIPHAAFAVDDIQPEYERLEGAGRRLLDKAAGSPRAAHRPYSTTRAATA